MTTNFYAPPSAFKGQRVVLPEGEARHVRAVLRAREGDEIVVVDGEGGWHRVTINHLSSEQAIGTVEETRRDVGEPNLHLTVALGLLTKRSRFETFVEKAVELGVRGIVPLHTTHTETETFRYERTRNVMIAALKQCRRSRLPALAEPKTLDGLLASTTADRSLICHSGEQARPLPQVLDDGQDGASILVVVGPEGGLAEPEVERAVDAGGTPVSLGPRRLRAETAGIAAATAVLLQQAPNGDPG
jgi:16S rRNA (uracil1498-N3)-methyltransferase